MRQPPSGGIGTHVHSGSVHGSEKLEATQASTHRRADKQNGVQMHNGILLSLRKQGNSTNAAEWMDIVDSMLSEVSRAPKDAGYVSRLCEVPRGVTSTETGSSMVEPGPGEVGMGASRVMGWSFSFAK